MFAVATKACGSDTAILPPETDSLYFYTDFSQPASLNGSAIKNLVDTGSGSINLQGTWSFTTDAGGGIDFSGDGYANGTISTQQSTNQYTILIWVKASTLTSAEQRLITIKESNPVNDGRVIHNLSGSTTGMTTDFKDTGGTIRATTASSGYATGNYYLYAAVYNQTTLRLLRNDSQIATQNFTQTPNSISTEIYLSYFSGQHLRGIIYGAAYYGKALTSQQLTDYYNATKSRFGL
jgi:hypothetical protein